MNGAWPGNTPKLPSAPGTTTMSTSSETRIFSGETSSNLTRSAISSGLGRHRARFFLRFLDRPDVEEGALGQIVVITLHDALEAADRVFEIDEGTGRAGEDFGHVEGLGHELLDPAGPRDGQLVLFGQLVHAQDGDDVLQGFILLEHALDFAGDRIMLLADDSRIHHPRGRGERI